MQEKDKQKILIADDERFNLNILVDILKSDYKIIVAKNGKQAIERAMSLNPPDLILLDIMMPEMDGYKACKNLKENEQTKDIPVIFITAMKEEGNEARGFDLGAVDYITKPFKAAIVMARVKVHLKMKWQADMLRKMASIDVLTEIPNRQKFEETFDKEWNRAVRNKIPLSVAFIDIDFFKQYNDAYGHGQGDKCLKEIAQALVNSIRRPTDFVARYGGEEFIAVLPETDISGAMTIAEAMRSNVELLKIPHAQSVPLDYVTISIGVSSVFPSSGFSDAALVSVVATADEMLYKAKSKGRNQIQCR
ncbi:MAG: diguanylate cyclase [Desulfobacula sp.]|uniref:diguanylate cyclase domain-containing protein n=1 Tax=Desulfobacula sp. TaxID=2593537 RepID=UPI0025C336BA|nr:diguanylate cyclase [Desulfobacula sp.]MCD4723092.1 diguanylate cyclase [Desulfobacula sp.]